MGTAAELGERKRGTLNRGLWRDWLGLLGLLILLGASGCGRRETDPEDTLEGMQGLSGVADNQLQEQSVEFEPQRAVVRVKAGNSTGSGVMRRISEDGTRLEVLTAAHVVEALAQGEQPVILLEDGTEWSCAEYICLENMDAAVLFLEEEELLERLREECLAREDKERYDSLKDGDVCIAIGGGEGSEWSAVTGEILDHWIYMEDYGQYMIWAEVPIHPGMSGGGLFDSEGYFLGILSGGSEDGQLAAVPWSLIEAAVP